MTNARGRMAVLPYPVRKASGSWVYPHAFLPGVSGRLQLLRPVCGSAPMLPGKAG